MSGRKRAPSASPWSNLPQAVISKIETRLDSAVDVFHLRSVCKNWRSSRNLNNISILSPLLPLIIPNVDLPFTDRPGAPLTLVARAVFLVKPLHSSSDSHGWLLTVEEMVPGMLRILFPLSKNRVNYLSSDFPKYLDLSNFRVSQVAKSYGLKYESDGTDVSGVRRVVVCSGITAMVLYGEGTLIGLRLRSGNWRFLRHSLIDSFSDVISCAGDHVRAVDYYGNVHIIDHWATKVVKTILLVSEIDKAYNINLLTSNGKLFAAASFEEHWSTYATTFKIELYRLDELQCKWIDDAKRDNCSKVVFVSSDWNFFVYTHDLDLRHYSSRAKRTQQKEMMSGDYVIDFGKAGGFYRRSPKMMVPLYKGSKLDLPIGVYFFNKDDLSFWQRAHCCKTTTIDVLWPPPTWFWPDTSSLIRDDEELDFHSQSCTLYSRKVQLPSFTANVSTGAGSANKEVLVAKSKVVGNSHGPAVKLSKEKDSKASFQGVEVQSEHLPILQEVWKKHGDVFEGSILQSCGLKAMALDCLAKILIILQTPGDGFTNDQVAYVESTFADLQCMRLKVDWLVPSVEMILGLHKQLRADLVALEEAKAKAEKTQDSLLAAMAKLHPKP